jgi:hypothetical protein
MDDVKRRLEASYQLFDKLKCCSRDLNGVFDDSALPFMEENKIRCQFLNCLAALRTVKIENSKKNSGDVESHELVKRKVFAGAILMMINTECDSNEAHGRPQGG